MSEERLAEIRERCKAALTHAPCVYYLADWPGILRNDVPFLLAEVERLTQCNQLEAAVVEAALAERRTGLAMQHGDLHEPPPGIERAWDDALDAYEVATDALLAFNDEEADARGEATEDPIANAETRARLKIQLADAMELGRLVEEAGDE